MAYNGAGTFTVTGTAFIAGTVIQAVPMNAKLNDLAGGLSNAVTRDGQSPPTANLPMGGFKHTNVADGAVRSEYASLGQVQDSTVFWAGAAGGTGDAITAALSPAPTALVAGMKIQILSSAANTGATTLNLNALGALALNKGDGTTALAAGDIPGAGYSIAALYDGTRWRLVSVNSSIGTSLDAALTAAAARTLLGAPAIPTASVGAGNWILIAPGDGFGVTLPAGGTWAYSIQRITNASGTFDGNNAVNIASGGTAIGAGLAGRSWLGFAWRIA